MNSILNILCLMLSFTIAGAALTTQAEEALAERTAAQTTLIVNARVIDGSGSPAFTGAIRVRDDRIIATGNLSAQPEDHVIDVRGLSLAPGFIDTHSHHDDQLPNARDALPLLSQGITTVVFGQDGAHKSPLSQQFRGYEDDPASVNIASYVGHNTLRDQVMGNDFKRTATPAEIDKMRTLLAAELANGALGLSTGLEYEPSLYSSTDEVLMLAQETANAGGRYISHIRSEDRHFWSAIDETINIGRVTGMPVQISHLKLASKALWGNTTRLLDQLDAARDSGINITADLYPYEYWESTIWVLLPNRNADDLEEIQFVLDQLTPPDGILFTTYKANPSYVGKTIADIAILKGLSNAETVSFLMKESAQWSQAHNGEDAESIMGRSMRNEDIAALLLWPHINLCSDGGYTGHPRGHGAFPRVLSHFVRETHSLSLEAAVHTMTKNAADHMGFKDRGVIQTGAIADLVLFNPDTIKDRASLENPQALSKGVEKVWVAGTLVFANGESTNARPGRVLRRLDDETKAQ